MHAPSEPATPEPAAEEEGGHRLQEDLDALLTRAAGGPIAFRDMLEVLGERSHAVLLLLIAAPFIFVPIPGVSTVFGVVLIVLAASIAANWKPWLPEFVCKRQVSNKVLTRLVNGTGRVLRKAERLFHPRLPVMFHSMPHRVAGLSLVMLSVAFSLPLPIPWNNGPPAIGITLLALGLLERDGLMVLIGIIYNAILWIVLCLLGGVIVRGIMEVWGKIQGLFT